MEYSELMKESEDILKGYKGLDEGLAERIVNELTEVIDPKFVSRDWALRVPYSQDTSGGGSDKPNHYSVPDIVVLPSNTQEVAHISRIALKYQVPISLIATGLNTSSMALPLFRGILIDFKRMNRILELDKEGLTITVEPYVNYARVQALLEPLGLRINVPGAPNSVSVLTNNLFIGMKFFSAKFGYGAMEMVGLEYVLPNGTVIRTGSLLLDPIEETNEYKPGIHEVPKNGDGRVCIQAWGSDLTGLPHQSVGGNGIVTKMCLKIHIKHPNAKILCYGFKELGNTTKMLSEICSRDIGYGGLLGATQDNAQANQHSIRDVEIFQSIGKNPIKAMKSGLQMMIKSFPLLPKKSFREILKGFMAMVPINYVSMVFLIGTPRKIEHDYEKVQNILNNRDLITEEPTDASPYQKHSFWPYFNDAKPEYIYKLTKNSGMKDVRLDWIIRGGKFLDYCEISARMMRISTGLSIKSCRVTYDKVSDIVNSFEEKLAVHYPEAIEEEKWGAVVIPGAGSYFICLEFVIAFDPNNQEEKEKTFKTFRDFIASSLKKGIFFTNHSKLYRDMLEKKIMPKVWEVVKSIRENIQATVLCPH